ncbi:hypothetical protein [uncultured Gammaproteobacteria bacterium]|nr:hypothetical protein [uncultured Gammaproteobacteria bacterium]CAC9644067.1 hypothetical protein [uncultured Gammaproteobacteria bacterium]CAC9971036.1 hypothetical protein [uncultured Gammaproteobacteria bacterium]
MNLTNHSIYIVFSIRITPLCLSIISISVKLIFQFESYYSFLNIISPTGK